MELIWTSEARVDLIGIREYIYQDNPDTAQKVEVFITDKAKNLLENPRIGRLTQVLGIRQLVMTKYPYKILYTVKGARVYIMGIQHTSREEDE